MPCLNAVSSFHDEKTRPGKPNNGAIAQLGERLPCTQEVSGSIPLSSTINFLIIQNRLEIVYCE